MFTQGDVDACRNTFLFQYSFSKGGGTLILLFIHFKCINFISSVVLFQS